jgi:hypothetical protein
MRMTILAAAIVLGATAGVAHADFWIVQDPASTQCRVVEQRPSGTMLNLVGSDKGYPTRVEAESQMRIVQTCKELTTGGPNPKLGTDTPLR